MRKQEDLGAAIMALSIFAISLYVWSLVLM